MKKCLKCGGEFEPKNPKGKFCSDKCRVYFGRLKKTINPFIGDSKMTEVRVWSKPKEPIEHISAPTSELKTVTVTLKSPSQTDHQKRMREQRIKDLESELKSPPKNPTIGLRKWKEVREQELKQLKQTTV